MAMSNLIAGLRSSLLDLERRFIIGIFGRQFPPPALLITDVPVPASEVTEKGRSLKEILEDAFLYAVPKHRRTSEKKLERKFGHPDRVWKILVPSRHIRQCRVCGHHYKIGILCKNCYSKVTEETNAMKERIMATLGYGPIETDVVVLYEGEKTEEQTGEHWQGKRIVEMEKPRPPWFSKNLLQKTTQQPATSTDVKPTDLA